MKFYACIPFLCIVFSCTDKIGRNGGDIKFVPRKGGETEFIFHNDNTTKLRDIGIFLSMDEMFDINPVKVEFRVTAPNNEYWLDTLYFDSKEQGNTVNFSGRKELYRKAYKNVCLMQGGDYKFNTRIIDISSDLMYMTGVIIENKNSGKK